MAKTKIALLYERLSRDDELSGESFQSRTKKSCWRTSPVGMGISVSSISLMTAFPVLALTGPASWR